MRVLLLLAILAGSAPIAVGQPVNVDDVVFVYVLRDGRKVGIEETTEPPIALPRLPARQVEAGPRLPARQVEAEAAAPRPPASIVVRIPAPEVARPPRPFPGATAAGLPPQQCYVFFFFLLVGVLLR